jgi:carbon starvation protein CstA
LAAGVAGPFDYLSTFVKPGVLMMLAVGILCVRPNCNCRSSRDSPYSVTISGSGFAQ